MDLEKDLQPQMQPGTVLSLYAQKLIKVNMYLLPYWIYPWLLTQ